MQATQTKVYTPEQIMATTFALSPEQRKLCDVSFLLHCQNIDYIAFKKLCLDSNRQFFIWSSPGMEAKGKLVASINFPNTPNAAMVEQRELHASTLISVRTYKNVTYALVVPAIAFKASGSVTTVHECLTHFADNCTVSMAGLHVAIDMGVL